MKKLILIAVLHTLLLWSVNTVPHYDGRYVVGTQFEFDLTITLCVLISLVLSVAVVKAIPYIKSKNDCSY